MDSGGIISRRSSWGRRNLIGYEYKESQTEVLQLFFWWCCWFWRLGDPAPLIAILTTNHYVFPSSSRVDVPLLSIDPLHERVSSRQKKGKTQSLHSINARNASRFALSS